MQFTACRVSLLQCFIDKFIAVSRGACRGSTEARPIMKRTSTLWSILGLSLLLQAAVTGAQAQNTAPSAAPPKMEQIEDVGDAPVTVTSKPVETQMTEKREQGRVTEVKVSSGGSTYYVKPNNHNGTATPGDVGGNRGPQWQVMEFDLGRKKQKQHDDDALDTTPAPPPPAK